MGPKRSDAERGEVAATASLGALKFRGKACWAWDFFLKFWCFGLVFIGKFGLKSTSYILLHVDLRFKI